MIIDSVEYFSSFLSFVSLRHISTSEIRIAERSFSSSIDVVVSRRMFSRDQPLDVE